MAMARHAALLPLEELLIEAWIKHPEQMAADCSWMQLGNGRGSEIPRN